MAKEKEIGKISHYYGKIGVAVVKVIGSLKIGQTIKIKRKGGEEFEQTVESMQVEHEKIKEAKKGDQVGMKMEQVVKPGDVVVEA